MPILVQLVRRHRRAAHQTVKSRKAIADFRSRLSLWITGRYLRTWRTNGLCLLFATGTGRPWDHSLVRKRKFHPLLRKLGVQQCGFHAFRHGNATLLDQINAPMAVRLNRLGHAEPQTTMNDTHMVTSDERRTAEELGKILHINLRNERQDSITARPLTLRIQ